MIKALKSVRHLTTAAMKQTVSEIHVPFPVGEMRGKSWGPEHGRPVLCLHGWSDNSGTFNTLIPLLPKENRYVAVDLPGHGLSFHRPAGSFYTFPAYIADVLRLTEVLQWERFSIIGHSMGGNIGGMFSALYPERVEALVLLDSSGFLPVDLKETSRIMRKGMDEIIEYEKKIKERKERVYTYEAAKVRLKAANPFLSDESANILLERGVQEVEGGVVFCRDVRINFANIVRISLEQSLHFQEQIKAKILLLQASQGFNKIFPQRDDIAKPLLKGWTKLGCKIVKVDGDHHVHLNNPEVVAPIIADFLQESQMSERASGSSDTNRAAKL